MRLAIISDIHSNREALEAVLADIRTRHVEQIVCLGDIVGYGADPAFCISMVREHAEFAVLGNHDWSLVHGDDTRWRERTNPLAREAADWTAKQLSSDERAYLSGLPLRVTRGDALFVHASPRHPSEWNYVFTAFEARNYARSFDERLCFIGHSHIPSVFALDTADQGYTATGRFIINVGSVGQPRDGDWRASYGVLDTVAASYDTIRVEYDVDSAMKKILAAGLPHRLAARLKVGQ